MSNPISHWSPANQERASRLLEAYPDRRSALMPLLYVASLEHRYASDDAMEEVAELTGITAAQVRSVATFYTMFKQAPVGEYLISVCTSISCHLLGGEDVLESVEEAAGVEHGSTGEDGLFSVEHVECIGACGGAPAVQVNYELIEGVMPDRAGALVGWLRDTKPDVVLADEMQQLFGGVRSFDWGPTEAEGAIRPVPAFAPYGSAREGR
ncbi:MAG: NAD(P)H-dependent oxidoreductase subunit E [Acidimicrobiia bacterium]|nr:NAD(P)H-dependent oxidoreductase subunit E [Acidimicrobiia bacterium]